jgi:hypothetical protein
MINAPANAGAVKTQQSATIRHMTFPPRRDKGLLGFFALNYRFGESVTWIRPRVKGPRRVFARPALDRRRRIH